MKKLFQPGLLSGVWSKSPSRESNWNPAPRWFHRVLSGDELKGKQLARMSMELVHGFTKFPVRFLEPHECGAYFNGRGINVVFNPAFSISDGDQRS